MKVTRRVKRKWIPFLTVLLVVFSVLYFSYGNLLRAAYPIRYQEYISREVQGSTLEPALVYAVIKAESNFDEHAVSHANAIGLMQITEGTFTWLQTKTPGEAYELEALYQPEVNIRYGCVFLQLLLEKYENTETALSAYNAGMGTVNSWLKDPQFSSDGVSLDYIPYPETRSYVKNVMENYQKYKELYKL